MYDCDDPKNLADLSSWGLSKHDTLGVGYTDLPYVMGQRGHATIALDEGKGTITVAVMEIGNDLNDMLEIKMGGVSLAKMDTFGQSDPYVKIFRKVRTGEEFCHFPL